MRQFQHGIGLAFLRPVGACFGLLIQQDEDVAEFDLQPSFNGQEELEHNGILLPQRGDAVKKDLQPTHERHSDDRDNDGDLLPQSGEEEDQQANIDLAEVKHNLEDKEEDGCLLPFSGENDGVLLPTSGVQEENSLQSIEGHEDKEDIGILLPEEWGNLQPVCATCDGGKVQPANEDGEGALPPTIGVPYYGEFFPSLDDYLQFDVVHEWTQVLFTHMHAEIGRLGMAPMVHDYLVIDHAKPRVDPKVKKKTSLLLCLFIDMPFHPGEYGHDGNPPYHHHEPYSSLCLYIESLHPPPHSFAKAPSSSDFSLLVILSNADHKKLQQAAFKTILFSLTPLRGRMDCQGREMRN